MAKYTVKGPDGKTWDVDAPEGSSEEDAIEYIATTKYNQTAAPVAQTTPPVEPTPQPSGMWETAKQLGKDTLGTVAAGVDMAHQLGSSAVAGIAGLGRGLKGAVTPGETFVGEAVKGIQGTQERLGQGLASVAPVIAENPGYQATMGLLSLPAEAGHKLGELTAEYTEPVIGRSAGASLGAQVNTLFQVGAPVAAFKGAKRLSQGFERKPSPKELEKARQNQNREAKITDELDRMIANSKARWDQAKFLERELTPTEKAAERVLDQQIIARMEAEGGMVPPKSAKVLEKEQAKFEEQQAKQVAREEARQVETMEFEGAAQRPTPETALEQMRLREARQVDAEAAITWQGEGGGQKRTPTQTLRKRDQALTKAEERAALVEAGDVWVNEGGQTVIPRLPPKETAKSTVESPRLKQPKEVSRMFQLTSPKPPRSVKRDVDAENVAILMAEERARQQTRAMKEQAEKHGQKKLFRKVDFAPDQPTAPAKQPQQGPTVTSVGPRRFNEREAANLVEDIKQDPKLRGTLRLPNKKQGGYVNFGILDDMVGLALKTSKSFNEFQMKISNFTSDPAVRKAVMGAGQKMWDNRDALLADFETNRQRAKTTGGLSSRYAESLQTTEEVLANTSGLLRKDDVNAIGNWLSTPAGRWAIYPGQVGHILRNVFQRTQDVWSESQVLLRNTLEDLKPFQNLAKKDRQKIMDTWSKFEKPDWSRYLEENNLVFPDQQLLEKAGLNPSQVQGYQAITQMFEKALDITNILRVKQGLDPIKMIPGYMPRLRPGGFSVRLKIGDELVYKKFDTKREAEAFANEAAADGAQIQTQFGERVGVHHPKRGNIYSLIDEALEMFDTNSKLDTMIRNRIKGYENRAAQKVHVHELERVSDHVGGYVGEKGIQPTSRIPFVDRKGKIENQQLTDLPFIYAEALAQYYKNVMIRKDILLPFEDAQVRGQFENTPNLSMYIKNHLLNNLEVNKNINQVLDSVLGSANHKIRQANRGLVSTVYFTRLFTDAGYAFASIAQPIFVSQALSTAWTRGKVLKEQTGSVGDAMMAGFETFWKPAGMHSDPFIRRGLKYLGDTGQLAIQSAIHLDASTLRRSEQAAMDIMKRAFKGELGPGDLLPEVVRYMDPRTFFKWVEERGRMVAAAAGMAYFRRVFPHNEKLAFDAGAKLMNQTMNNYNREHQAQIYSQLPDVVAETTRPFMSMTHQIFANINDAVQVMADAKRKGHISAKDAALASTNLAGNFAIFGLLGGLTAMPFLRETQAINDALRELNPNTPDILGMVKELNHEQGIIPEGLMHGGVLSMAAGAGLRAAGVTSEENVNPNLGRILGAPSLGGVGGMAALGPMRNLGRLAKYGIQSAGESLEIPELTGRPDRADLYAGGRGFATNLPSALLPEGLQAASVGGWEKQFMLEEGLVPQASNLSAGYRRSEDEQKIMDLFGTPATTETSKKDKYFRSYREESMRGDAIKRGVSIFVDSLLSDDGRAPDIMIDLVLNQKVTNTELRPLLTQEIKRRTMDPEMRMMDRVSRLANNDPGKAAVIMEILNKVGIDLTE